MAEKTFTNKKNLKLIKNIKKTHHEIDEIFRKIGAFNKNSKNEMYKQNDIQRINSKLDKKIKSIINLSFKLEETVLSSFLETNRTTTFLSYVLIAVIIFLGLIIFYTFNKDIIKPILEIENGTQKIGEGNLSYEININKDTEIGDLADEINRMTDKLKSTLISREKLKDEIEQRKKLENENKKHLEELEKNKKKLEKLNEKLSTSNKELEQFAYIASHDLQEPLRKVRNFAELLKDKYKKELDDKADKYLYYIVDGAERMQILIDDLLTYSRLNTRKKPFKNININKL